MTVTTSESRARGVLKSTVAAVCVAATAAAPALAAGRPEAAVVASGPVDVRVATNPQFTRVEFHGVLGARATVRTEGRDVVVRLPRGAEPNLGRLKVDPPQGVVSVETRKAATGPEVVLRLADGAQAKSGRADGAVFLNLFHAPAEGATGPAAVGRPDPVPASGVVKVAAQQDGGVLSLRFPWAAPLGSAVFKRGGAVWIVFDAKAKLDLSAAPKSLGAVKRVRWAAGPDFTVVRVDAPEGLSVQTFAEGSTWRVVFGAPTADPPAEVKVARDDQAGPAAVTAAMSAASRVLWLTDPVVGDRLAVVTATGPAKPVLRRRAFVEGSLLATAHGVAVEAGAADLRVAIEGDLIRIDRPQGLRLSSVQTRAQPVGAPEEMPQPALLPGAIDAQGWTKTGSAGFLARYRQLQTLAAMEGEKGREAPIAARMALARFLVGMELSYEAIGVLNDLARTNGSVANDPEFRGLRGAARAMAGRYKEAQADFSAPSIVADPAAALWRGYIDSKLGSWAEARKAFVQGARSVDLFPPKWRARFATAHAQAALEEGDPAAAQSLLAFALSQKIDAEEQLAARLVQARALEAQGRPERALAIYEAVGRVNIDALATPALLRATKLSMDQGRIPAAEAVKRLESLKYRWRGDSTEIDVIRTLGEIYLGQGRYREALAALRTAGGRLPDTPAAIKLQAELADAFRALFLNGQADRLEPIQALALFYDFRELTPVGADGDEMVRRLARRLIDVDLLPQAAELLKYQVDNRLDGVAKGQVATDLAAVYLMDHRPEQALQAIWGSRTTLLPNALNAQRRVLESRALAELGRFDGALEILGKDGSADAADARAEVYWRQKAWPQAGASLEKRLGDRWKQPGPLSGEEETRLIRAGVAYSLAGDGKSLQRLSERYGRFVDQARSPDALRVALSGFDAETAKPGEFARLAAGSDTFSGWVGAMKKRFREEASAPRTAASSAPKAG
jgi:tetratricopeptide (TPR) repeat protein